MGETQNAGERDHPRLDIGEIKRDQLCPQHVALETQRGQNGFLLSAGPRVGFDIGVK